MNNTSLLTTVKQPNPELHSNPPFIYPFVTNTPQRNVRTNSQPLLQRNRRLSVVATGRASCFAPPPESALSVQSVVGVVVVCSRWRMANSEKRCGCWQTSSGDDRGRRPSAATLGNTYTQPHHHHQPVGVIVKSGLRCTESTLRDDDHNGMFCGSGSIDLSDRFHRLSNTVRHDFATVYTMIKVIDDKLHALEEYFVRARHQEKWSAISETVTQTDSIRLDQIATKCDQILKRLDAVESKLESPTATVSLDDISAQLNQLSKDVHRLSTNPEPHSSKVKHVTLVTDPQIPSKPLHAKMFTLNPKQRISSFLAPRSKGDNETLIPKVNSNAQPKQTPTPPTLADDSLSEETLAHCAARLRDAKVMTTVRIFLAFLADQPPSVCYDGMTCTSARMFLALEGFPVTADKLKELYLRVHEANGLGRKAVLEDLTTYRAFIASERIQRMQRARESTDKFYGRNVSKSK